MSVPTYKRSESNVEYLNILYQMNIALAEIVMNKPSKYRINYGDKLICYGIEALRHAQAANSIYIAKTTSEQDFLLRRRHLQEARALVDTISTVSFIFLEHCKKADNASGAKIIKQEKRIGEFCNKAHDKLGGVLKYDAENHKKYVKAKA